MSGEVVAVDPDVSGRGRGKVRGAKRAEDGRALAEARDALELEP